VNKLLYTIEDLLEVLKVEDDILQPGGIAKYEKAAADKIRSKTEKIDEKTLKKIDKVIDKIDPEDSLSVEVGAKRVGDELKKHGKKVAPISSTITYRESELVYKKTKKRLSIKTGEEYGFGYADELAIDRINMSTEIFIGEHYQDEVTETVKKYITETLNETKTLDRTTIANKLKEKMPQYVKQAGYFDVVVGQVLNTARNYSNMRFYEEAYIDRYVVVAVNDQRTTVICQFMDGMVLEVAKTLKRYEMYDTAASPDEVKEVNPWIKHDAKTGLLSVLGKPITPEMTGDDLQALGLNAPPYHGRCRTTVTAVI
jgi:hypothetical protein